VVDRKPPIKSYPSPNRSLFIPKISLFFMEFFDMREIKTKSLTLTIENGRMEKPKYENFHGKSFRVLKNKKWGFFSGLVDDKEGYKRAETNIVGEGDEEIDTTSFSGEFNFKQKKKLESVDLDEKINLIRDVERSLKGGVVVSTRVTYIENIRKLYYTNSEGAELRYVVPRTGIAVQIVGKNGSLQFLSKRLFKPGGFEVTSEIFDVIDSLPKTLEKLVIAHTPPSGRMNVLMDHALGGVFIHEAFGHAVEADHLSKGASILKETGIRVGSEELNVFDDPLKEEFGYFPFDDEGFLAERKHIIENGVFKEFLHSRSTAKKFGGRAGNSRSQGVMEPIIRTSNTYIDEGDYTFEELLEEVKNGVYLIGTRGGETNPATGYFHFNAQYGYLVLNGEIRQMIRDVSLSGHTLEILRDMKIGKGVKFEPGFCGKSGQLVPVSDGAPPTVVNAFVGGG
jgi:TldD protein